ncbi:hypothetical protein NHX12_007940 [Muraenolepis orangiensis]|uniref:GLTSCR protein conserved domain-containing protein n=1 Tax=Muraenolepis orangiensis TaxID=630683 RepID=A0A9Q0DM35_9TELE|nr:hypothetical protein NHX12_007940 [Muraenolepis orangiensis]
MDDEDGRCLLDVICDPEALNDFLHGSETHLDTDDLLDGSGDPSSSFFSAAGGHIPEVQPVIQLSVSEPVGLPRVSVDLDFLEDDDILGGSPGADGGSNGIGGNHEPCDILQQSLAEANITEQSLQEAEAELDLGSFGIPGLTQVVQTLPDSGLSGTAAVAVGIGAPPPNAVTDMLGSVLAHQGLAHPGLHQVMNKAISVQPFMHPVGLGNVTLQSISSLQALPNGSQSGHLGMGQIQVVGQPTVMTINQAGQPVLAKAMGSYHLHQPGPEVSGAGPQAGLGGSVLTSGGGLLIQGGKAALGSPVPNGPAVCVSSAASGGVTTPAGLVGYAGAGLETQTQGQVMQNVIIQRTPTPIQPKPPQGGAFQPKVFKQPQPAPHPLQGDATKALGLQQIPVSAAQNMAFLTGKAGSNVVLGAPGQAQGQHFQQVFKQQPGQPSGKPLSVHLLNQQGSIVIPSQALQGHNHQLLQLQAGGQIFTQHHSGHLIANQILSANQNINLGQMLATQGHPGPHIISGPIQLQAGQMAASGLFQMPVTRAQSHPHGQTVIQGVPVQNSLTTLGQVEGLSPAVSLQPALQPPVGGVPGCVGGPALAGDCITESAGHSQQLVSQQASILMQSATPSAVSVPCSSPSMSVTTATVPTVGLTAQHGQGRVLFTNQGPGMILSQESLQMFLQQDQQRQNGGSAPSVGVPASVIASSNSHVGPAPSVHESQLAASGVALPGPSCMMVPSGHQQHLKIQSLSPSPGLATHGPAPPPADSPQPSPSPLALGQHAPVAIPVQHQFASSLVSGVAPVVLNAEQQHHLQLVVAQIQTLSTISQPSLQQKQLLDKLHQVQQNILLQAKQSASLQLAPQPQAMAPALFGSQQDQPLETGAPAPPGGPALQHKSVLVKTPVVTGDMQVLSGAQGPGGAGLTPPMAPAGLTPQPAQIQTAAGGVISALGGGVTLGPGGIKLQVLGSSLAQMPALQAPMPIHTQIPTVKMPFSAEPSKEARMLEQLRKQQGSVLHPNHGAPFDSFGDSLQRLLPYHLYQGTANSAQDYQRVDDEFESVSSQLLKRTQAMLDKYRHLLFAESKRMGPSAEMVMIDRMFIQEEKLTLGQDRLMAQERPEEFVANARRLESAAAASSRLHPSPAALIPAKGLGVAEAPPAAPSPVAHPPALPNAAPPPTPVGASSPPRGHAPFPSTKLVIKQGGGGASVSWASGVPPPPPPPQPPPVVTKPTATKPAATKLASPPAKQSSSFGRTPPPSSFKWRSSEDEDALPQRTSKPPIKTYEARRRIGLKLKIKQDQTGFRKVVHNTALDPVHTPPQQKPYPRPQSSAPRPEPSVPPTVIRTQLPPAPTPAPSVPAVATLTASRSDPPLGGSGPSSAATPPPPSSSSSSRSWSPCPPPSSSSKQMNGTLEHHEVGGVKRDPAATATPPQATTCRLPLRKTYRENVSPRVRPGVPGGGDDSLPYPRPELSPPPLLPQSPAPLPPPPPPPPLPPVQRSVIASVKEERRSREEEEVFDRGIKTTQQQHHHHLPPPHLPRPPVRGEERREEERSEGRFKRASGPSQRQGAVFRMDQHAPGPPSPDPSSPDAHSRDPSSSCASSLPAKRCKSDSPDMDDASFSSGSPPDDRLTEHLQSAIDSILNLQQGPSARHLKRPRQHHPPGAPPHRPPAPPPSSSSSSSAAPLPGRGHNGSLVPQNHSR